MLKISGLVKEYESTCRRAADRVSLTVEDGIIYGFLGHNGAGKSTTIKCMTGILPYDEGTIALDGVSLIKKPLEYKKHIGYVPDLNNAYERISGRTYVRHIARLFSAEKCPDERIDALADMLALSEALDRPIKTYSHGMKQKLVTIAAVIHEPKLLILDEPMTGMDPASTRNFIAFLKRYVLSGNSVFFSSHLLAVVSDICDKIGVIREGKMLGEFFMKDLPTGGLKQFYTELTKA